MSAARPPANSVPGAPEPGRDLVQDQRIPCSSHSVAQQLHALGRVEAHPARALHDRLDDHARELVLVEQRRARRAPTRRSQRGSGAKTCCGSDALPHRVHAAVGVAHGHRAERVAVVAAAPGQQRSPLAVPVLQHELDRDLDRHGAGVGEEHVVEPGPVREPLREPDRPLVREPAEHHVRHAVRAGRAPPRRSPGAGSRGSRTTTTPSRRSARARRRASAARRARTPPAAAA